jgi:DNA mismatch repair protein MutS
VARLAGLPLAVVERARKVLARHEEREHTVTEELSPGAERPVQISIFTPMDSGVAERLRAVNLDELRPIDALNLLSDIKKGLA